MVNLKNFSNEEKMERKVEQTFDGLRPLKEFENTIMKNIKVKKF